MIKLLKKVFNVRYTRFLLVGSVLALSTILMREIFEILLRNYLISVVISYIISIILSFLSHKKFTYNSSETFTYISFLKYVFVALCGLLITSGLSVLLNNWVLLISMFGKYNGSISFTMSIFVSSLATYWLNGRFVFNSNLKGKLVEK